MSNAVRVLTFGSLLFCFAAASAELPQTEADLANQLADRCKSVAFAQQNPEQVTEDTELQTALVACYGFMDGFTKTYSFWRALTNSIDPEKKSKELQLHASAFGCPPTGLQPHEIGRLYSEYVASGDATESILMEGPAAVLAFALRNKFPCRK